MGDMEELGMEERQQSEIMGEPKTCVRCGWKTWSMKSRACTYPGGIHKFGPVLGGGDTEGGPLIPEKVGPTSEPDVLEPLRRMLEAGGIANPRHREKVADAIAEIKRLRGELMALVHCGFCGETWTEEHRWCDPELAQLRAITEAKPVWQARRIVHGHAFKWFGIHESEVRPYNADPDYETRALAVVAPKGDTE